MKRMSPDALRNLPVAGTFLGLVAIAALGLAYWGNVTSRERYLQSRNFRLLSDVAEQAQIVLYDSEQIVRRSICEGLRKVNRDAADNMCKATTEGPKAADGSVPLAKEVAEQWASGINSDLQAKRQGRGAQGREGQVDRRIAPIELWRGEATIHQSTASAGRIPERFKQYRTRVVSVGSDLRLDWAPEDERLPVISFQVPAAALFSGAFNQARWDRAFSTMALAAPDGRIVFAVGAQAAELKASRVAALLPGAPEKDASNLMRFASVIADEGVRIAGIDYRMFTQPCCRVESLGPAVNSSTPGLVVIGLSEADALRSLSLAISPVLVLAGVAFVMLCLVGWAFLKCWLMGAQQRLGRHDVINLLASGMFGVALATTLLLTVNAYSRLGADMDAHLQHLATAVHDKFTLDLEGATQQLQRMVTKVDESECENKPGSQPGSGQVPNDPCQAVARPWGENGVDLGYKDFITFAMVDKSGLQAVKAASTEATRTIVDVSQRVYFQQAQAGDQLWRLPPQAKNGKAGEAPCPNGCYLEYISSWNTGQPQVVIAMPTTITRLPVATLSIPMHSLLAPVLPPGFEFAVVDSQGIVQFHSDPQRNGRENLLLETDQNARLRSLLAARSAGSFNTMYWGYPYRAYVRPTRISGWSVVLLHSKQTKRALVLEWFTVAMLFAGLYTLGWTVAMLPSLWHGASWLWPDPLRRHWYAPIGSLAVVATLGWLAIAWRAPVFVTALTGIVLPILVWAIAYGVLAVRPAGAGEVKGWTGMCRSYKFAGTALLLLTAAVPAASFYALSFDRHIEAFVKERQLGLARSIDALAECGEKAEPDKDDKHVARYDDKDHDGDITCVTDSKANTAGSPLGQYLHELFEEYIPYFTSASVSLREFMHETSEDYSWHSERDEARSLALRLRSRDPTMELRVATTLPAIVGLGGTAENSKLVLVALGALVMLLAVLGTAYFVVTFLLQRVLLADIVEPLRRGHRIVTQVGQHLQVICLDPARVAMHVNDLHLLRTTCAPGHTDVRALEDIKAEASAAPASQRIGIFDLQQATDDASLLQKKLEIVEAVMDLPNQTVLLFTRQGTGDLGEWVRARCDSSLDRDRWSRMIARLRVTELPARSATSLAERWKHNFHNLLQGWREEFTSRWRDLSTPLDWRARLLEREGQSHPRIDEIATELQNSTAFVDGSLSRDQILEEIEESADRHYREIWRYRSEDERVVLEHVARYGLASAASRRVVRRLLAEGLLRKDPELRLMSDSFRRFVLEPERIREVAALELQLAPSLWDRLRVPLATSGILALLFLLVTQREALDTTMSMAVGVTTAGTTLVKLTSLVAQLGGRGGPKANA